ERNGAAILAVLAQTLPATGTVLEIASGTGQHAAFFAPELGPRLWQPTERDTSLLSSISAWAAEAHTDRLLPPVVLDVCAPIWPVETMPPPQPVSAIFVANMVHIAPWAASEGLFAGAGRVLPCDGVLTLYGPFRRDGQHTAPSNAAFDAGLRQRDPSWGVRDLGDITRLATTAGLMLTDTIAMPANNLSLVFTRR
ncbi:MAG: DUF938 domain-containing protein, partial [Alphaproteobacteria bacterium]